MQNQDDQFRHFLYKKNMVYTRFEKENHFMAMLKQVFEGIVIMQSAYNGTISMGESQDVGRGGGGGVGGGGGRSEGEPFYIGVGEWSDKRRSLEEPFYIYVWLAYVYGECLVYILIIYINILIIYINILIIYINILNIYINTPTPNIHPNP